MATDKTQTLAAYFACKLDAHANCVRSGNQTWQDRHTEACERAALELLPSGSGFDSGTPAPTLIYGVRFPALRFTTEYHHMSENGYYTHWSEWSVIVWPTFSRFDCDGYMQSYHDCETMAEMEDFADYIGDEFHHALSKPVDANGVLR